MKKSIISLFIFLLFTLSSCEVFEAIFKFGFWLGVIVMIVILLLIGIILYKIFGD